MKRIIEVFAVVLLLVIVWSLGRSLAIGSPPPAGWVAAYVPGIIVGLVAVALAGALLISPLFNNRFARTKQRDPIRVIGQKPVVVIDNTK